MFHLSCALVSFKNYSRTRMNEKLEKKLFIFERIDHVGKSTLCRAVLDELKTIFPSKIPLSIYSSPGKETYGSLGNVVYRIHHKDYDDINEEMNPMAMQMLHVAAHINNLKNRILPCLAAGKCILLDRFWWSTIAYGIGDNLPIKHLMNIVSPEVDVFEEIKNSIQVFYISRNTIVQDYEDEKMSRILNQYNSLIVESNYKVTRIDNNHSIQKAKDEVTQKIIENCQ